MRRLCQSVELFGKRYVRQRVTQFLRVDPERIEHGVDRHVAVHFAEVIHQGACVIQAPVFGVHRQLIFAQAQGPSVNGLDMDRSSLLCHNRPTECQTEVDNGTQ